MTKRTKRYLFYSALAFFLLLSYVIILYAQGYKYNLSEFQFFRTGTVALKVNTDAKVFLNDELQGGTSFFNNSYSIDGLLPGTYEIMVQRDGYSQWKKTAIVEEGFVTDYSNILILPEQGEDEQNLFDEVALLFKELEPVPTVKITPSPSPSKNQTVTKNSLKSPSPIPTSLMSPTPDISDEPFLLDNKSGILYRNSDDQMEEIAKGVKGFRLSQNSNKITWWSSNELWVIWLNDQNYQPFYKRGDTELITRLQIPIQNGTWFRGEDHIILELEQTDSKGRPYSIYRIFEIDKRGGVNVIEL